MASWKRPLWKMCNFVFNGGLVKICPIAPSGVALIFIESSVHEIWPLQTTTSMDHTNCFQLCTFKKQQATASIHASCCIPTCTINVEASGD